jgi:c-di-GMP-binding flagellar brake protein YcgR
MAATESVKGDEVAQIASLAARRRAIINLTIQHRNTWLPFQSHILGVRDRGIWVDMPAHVEDVNPQDVLIGTECSVSFRLNSHRYFFDTRSVGAAPWTTEDGNKVEALRVPLPGEMERLERRAFDRVEIPSSQMVRATIWSGWRQKPVWSGSVTNMSSGGLQIRTARTAMNFFESGDMVNIAVCFGADAQPVAVEAHFRHGTLDGTMCLAGMEFVMQNLSAAGQQAMAVITQRLAKLRQEG